MQRRTASMRLRLTLTYMLVFGLIQAAVCLVIVAQRDYHDAVDFDVQLADHARTLGRFLEVASDGLVSPLSAGRSRPATRIFESDQVFYQVRLLDGALVESSPELPDSAWAAVIPPVDELRRQRFTYATLHDDSVRKVLGRDGALRVITQYHQPVVGSPLILQVGVDLAPLRETIHDRRRMFLMMSLLSLVPAGLTTWILAKRALRPLQNVADQVRAISPRELTQRIQMEDPPEELVRLTDTVNQMLERLHQAFHAQDLFLTNAAHELKTPLSILMGSAQVTLRKARTREEYEQCLREAECEMRRLTRTVDGLLALARAYSRDPTREPVSATDFVTTALERCQYVARRWKVQLDLQLAFDAERDADPLVMGDRGLLATMVENLVRNAVRLSPEGTPVEVEVSIHNGSVRIAVRDRGPGIPEDLIPNIFDEFVTHSRDGRSSGGTGIGLSLARSVAQLHGGSIAVANRPGGGAQFDITLPLTGENGGPHGMPGAIAPAGHDA